MKMPHVLLIINNDEVGFIYLVIPLSFFKLFASTLTNENLTIILKLILSSLKPTKTNVISDATKG